MIRLKVNGKERAFDGDPEMPLLWYLRDVLGLTGTKFGCGMALCGACTVHHNGQAIRSCTTSLKGVAGGEITTIEGIAPMHPVQRAWMDIRVPQCGYCQTGQIMQAIALLKDNKNPSDQDIDTVCPAISAAAELMRGFGQPFTRQRRRRHEHRECFPSRIPARCSCRQRVRPERPLRP